MGPPVFSFQTCDDFQSYRKEKKEKKRKEKKVKQTARCFHPLYYLSPH